MKIDFWASLENTLYFFGLFIITALLCFIIFLIVYSGIKIYKKLEGKK